MAKDERIVVFTLGNTCLFGPLFDVKPVGATLGFRDGALFNLFGQVLSEKFLFDAEMTR